MDSATLWAALGVLGLVGAMVMRWIPRSSGPSTEEMETRARLAEIAVRQRVEAAGLERKATEIRYEAGQAQLDEIASLTGGTDLVALDSDRDERRKR